MIGMGLTSDGRPDMTNVELGLTDVMMPQITFDDDDEDAMKCCPELKNAYIRPSCCPVSMVAIFIALFLMFPAMKEGLWGQDNHWLRDGICRSKCSFILVESIPEHLSYINFTQTHMSTFDAWKLLLQRSKNKLDIAAFYWTLTSQDTHKGRQPSAWQGEEIFSLLNKTGFSGTKIRIAQNMQKPSPNLSNSDILAINGAAEVRSLNFSHWFGSGELHTKLLISDSKDFYIGSANMDWRSLTQMKELGVLVLDCPCLALDIQKLFDLYWTIGAPNYKDLPKTWPSALTTQFNATKPLVVDLNHTYTHVFLSNSPAALCPKNREAYDSSIVHVISTAQHFIHIAIRAYVPVTLYSQPQRFLSSVDNALRASMYNRGVHVKLICSQWNHQMLAFLRSLVHFAYATKNATMQVKIFDFKVANGSGYSRVENSNYAVSDSTAMIGTSSWEGDIFESAGGASIVLRQFNELPKKLQLPKDMELGTDFVTQVQDIFSRDWNSEYAKPLHYYDTLIKKNRRNKL